MQKNILYFSYSVLWCSFLCFFFFSGMIDKFLRSVRVNSSTSTVRGSCTKLPFFFLESIGRCRWGYDTKYVTVRLNPITSDLSEKEEPFKHSRPQLGSTLMTLILCMFSATFYKMFLFFGIDFLGFLCFFSFHTILWYRDKL